MQRTCGVVRWRRVPHVRAAVVDEGVMMVERCSGPRTDALETYRQLQQPHPACHKYTSNLVHTTLFAFSALMDNIKTWTGLSVEESIRMTEDRDKWRKYVHGVANPRIEDG